MKNCVGYPPNAHARSGALGLRRNLSGQVLGRAALRHFMPDC